MTGILIIGGCVLVGAIAGVITGMMLSGRWTR